MKDGNQRGIGSFESLGTKLQCAKPEGKLVNVRKVNNNWRVDLNRRIQKFQGQIAIRQRT